MRLPPYNVVQQLFTRMSRYVAAQARITQPGGRRPDFLRSWQPTRGTQIEILLLGGALSQPMTATQRQRTMFTHTHPQVGS